MHTLTRTAILVLGLSTGCSSEHTVAGKRLSALDEGLYGCGELCQHSVELGLTALDAEEDCVSECSADVALLMEYCEEGPAELDAITTCFLGAETSEDLGMFCYIESLGESADQCYQRAPHGYLQVGVSADGSGEDAENTLWLTCTEVVQASDPECQWICSCRASDLTTNLCVDAPPAVDGGLGYSEYRAFCRLE